MSQQQANQTKPEVIEIPESQETKPETPKQEAKEAKEETKTDEELNKLIDNVLNDINSKKHDDVKKEDKIDEVNDEVDITDSEDDISWFQSQLKEKRDNIDHWKAKVRQIGSETVDQIISGTDIPSDNDYFKDFKPVNIYNCPVNMQVKNYLREWKSRTFGIDKEKRSLSNDEKAKIQEHILDVCNTIKWVEDYIKNGKVNIEDFKFKAYPQLLKTKKILINLYKSYNKVDCARFLRNHKVTRKYGNKKYEETKPKKNN